MLPKRMTETAVFWWHQQYTVQWNVCSDSANVHVHALVPAGTLQCVCLPYIFVVLSIGDDHPDRGHVIHSVQLHSRTHGIFQKFQKHVAT